MEPPVDLEPLEEKSGSDIREHLTLHVQKRQADEGCDVPLGQPEFEQVRKKILKKTRKKKPHTSISEENKKRLKVKSEYIPIEESCMDNGEETNYESEDISPTDELNPELVQPVSAVSNGDSLANNCILNEILSEKKRALLESPEMIEFLQSRIRTS
ncbi:uncharacterized protein [Anabrus simplex]